MTIKPYNPQKLQGKISKHKEFVFAFNCSAGTIRPSANFIQKLALKAGDGLAFAPDTTDHANIKLYTYPERSEIGFKLKSSPSKNDLQINHTNLIRTIARLLKIPNYETTTFHLKATPAQQPTDGSSIPAATYQLTPIK